MLSVMVDLLQKLRQYEAAVVLLEELLGQDTHLQDHRGLWYTRLALNLHSHLRKPAKVFLKLYYCVLVTFGLLKLG